MSIAAAASNGSKNASHHGKSPAGGNHHPAGALRLGTLEQDAGDYAIAQEDQNESTQKFTEEPRIHQNPLFGIAKIAIIAIIFRPLQVCWPLFGRLLV